MMAKLQARWIHGTSVEPENPQNMKRIWKPGFGAFSMPPAKNGFTSPFPRQ